MKFATLLSAVFLLQATAQTFTPAGTAKPFLYPNAGGLAPTWTGGALVSIESKGTAAPVIHSFDDAGQEIPPIAFTLPGAKAITIFGFARGADGSFALAGASYADETRPFGSLRESFLTWISPDHQTVITSHPTPYTAASVTIAPDGTLWTIGMEQNANGFEKGPTVDRSHGAIRHFDTSGHQLGAFLPRSELPRTFGGSPLLSSKDRVAWYARLTQDYYEVTFDGKVTHYPGLPKLTPQLVMTRLALTSDNEVIGNVGQRDKSMQLYRFDRTTSAWTPIPAPPGTTYPRPDGRHTGPELYGADANRLVFSDVYANQFQLKFFTVAPK